MSLTCGLGTRHRDNENDLEYEVTRLAVITREEKVPIHITDIHRLTADL